MTAIGLVALLALPAGSAVAAPPTALEVSAAAGSNTLTLAGNVLRETPAEIRHERVIPVPNDSTDLVLWEEVRADQPPAAFYAITENGELRGRVRATSYVVRTRLAVFDPGRRVPVIGDDLVADGNVNLYLVQFVTQPLEVFHRQIEELGGTVYNFLADHTHIVRMDPATREAVAALPYVRWVGPYHPAYRLEEFMRENRALAPELFPRQTYNIQVFEAGLKMKQVVADRIRALGGKIDRLNSGKFLLRATLTPAQLFEVAGWDEVLFIDRWSPLEKDMDIVRQFGGADSLETVAGFTGAGVHGEAFDAGCQAGHQEFQLNPPLIHGSVGVDSHGTATAGVCFATGVDPQARGLLPDGQLIVGDYNDVGLFGLDRYTHTGEQIQAPYYAVFETASVGSDRTTQYTTISADKDAALFDFDIIHCQSQSNAGDQMSRPQAWAKNIVAGGGIRHYDTLDAGDDCWCSGASIGPATDGRIKPDLCGFYDDIYTTYSTSTTGYGQFGGTSGATPIIAGHFGLFFQMWSQGIFGNEVYAPGTGPTGNDVFDNRPHMATAKAMLINNAQQYPFIGSGADLSRYKQGWGFPDVQRIYDMREKMFVIDESEVLENLESIAFPLAVEPGEAEFRATMVYADPPGTPGALHHRINDVTLKVTSPAGDTYWGNHGLIESNWSVANEGSANTVDTVENVFVQNPESGIWLVEIFADEVIEDGHVETEGVLDVAFGLVVSGVIPCTSTGTVNVGSSLLPCEAETSLRVLDCDLNLDDEVAETVTITIASTTEPTGESVVLTETGPSTAAFEGSITLSTTDGDGILAVAHGDTVTATYIDEDDGQGGMMVEVTDTATIDCQAPAISGVTATDIQPRSATVTFDADEPVRGTVYYGLSCDALDQSTGSGAFATEVVMPIAGLMDDTTYYFAVEAEDAAGNAVYDDNGGACYSFTTPEVPDFFTEELAPNDLHNLSLTFEPSGGVDFYAGCTEEIDELPTDPTGGTTIGLSDDDYEAISPPSPVLLYGVEYTTIYVGSNGYLTFTEGDTDVSESLSDHFEIPRISGLFDDLNPATGGSVSWKALPDRVAITYYQIPEFSATGQNTFQFELFYDGVIRINYLDMTASDGLAGLSAGNGVDPDYFPSDLSNMGACGPRPPRVSDTTVEVPIDTATPILLEANDDGLPDPPAALTFVVASLPQYGDLADAGTGTTIIESDLPYTLVDGGAELIYTPSGGFFGDDGFTWQADDGGVPPEGGLSDLGTVNLLVLYDPPQITTTDVPDGCLEQPYPPFQFEAEEGQPDLSWTIIAEGEYTEVDLGESQFEVTGVAQGWSADDNAWNYQLPFGFPFFGQEYLECWVCSNGFINFNGSDSDYTNSVEELIQNVRIAPLWDDLKTNSGGDIYIAETPDAVTIRWDAVTFSGSNPTNVSVTLYIDGTIRFHYGAGNTGLTPTIGISGGTGTAYLLSTYDGASQLTDANSMEQAPIVPLPEGLVLSEDGTLSGTPLEAGEFLPRIRVIDSLGRTSEVEFTLTILTDCPSFATGDLNCDGSVDGFDIDAFVIALSDPAGYAAEYPDCDRNLADVNGDGAVDGFDIDPFVVLLTGK